ncbi:MAG: hypothetical protein MUP81_02260 [Dehalococcoidia bacterium]|nr:hypothetical protein [Dehalococcoidia bacterium]
MKGIKMDEPPSKTINKPLGIPEKKSEVDNGNPNRQCADVSSGDLYRLLIGRRKYMPCGLTGAIAGGLGFNKCNVMVKIDKR